jgi:hypothetical protein
VRLRLLALPLLAAAAIPATAVASAPRKGATYRAVLVLKASGNTFRAPLSFKVAADGRSVGSFAFPKGVPAATTCAQGPLGDPVSTRAPVRRGAFAVRLPLHLADNSSPGPLGSARIAGTFRANGRFAGTLTNDTTASSCRATFRFTAHT